MPAPDAANPTRDLRTSAGELAALLGADLAGPSDLPITGIAPIESGSKGDLTFVRARSFAKHWASSDCSAVLVTRGIELPPSPGRAVITVDDADAAFAKVLARLDPGTHTPPAGVHPSCVIDPGATVSPRASLGPNCVVSAGAVIEDHAVLIARVFVGADTTIAEHATLHAGVVIGDRCRIGKRTVVHPNAVVGADGFGYIPPTDDRPAIKVPQIGSVLVGEDCEIGAGTTIDRAKIGATRIGDRVKIDNLVHIAHNCAVGDDSILCGRTTLGGSVTLGKRVMVGGAVTIADQATVGDHARIAGAAVVMDAVPANETYAGIPAMPARTALANHGAMRTLAEFMRRVDKTLAKLTPRDEPGDNATPTEKPAGKHTEKA